MNFKSVGQMEYLVYSDLQHGEKVNAICYVVAVKKAVSDIGTNFYRLVVRSVDGKQMVCTILDTQDFDKLGFRLNAVVNKYVKLEALVQSYENRFSLRFITMNVVENVTPDLVMKFQKSIEGIDEYYEQVDSIYSTIFNSRFPLILKNKSYPNIYNGYAGGFVKLTWDMMIQCQSIFSNLDYDNSLDVMFASLLNYSNFLNQTSELNLVTDSFRIDFVSKIPNNDFTGRLIRETTASLIGLCKPNHLVSVLIDKTFNDLMFIDELKNLWDMTMVGGTAKCRDIELLKY